MLGRNHRRADGCGLLRAAGQHDAGQRRITIRKGHLLELQP
jgi:hypothetical protein